MHKLVTFLVFSMAFAPSPPMGLSGTEWPLERILENLNKRLAEKPDDAGTYYALGRTYAFAFGLERTSLLVYSRDNRKSGPERFVYVLELDRQVRHGREHPEPPTPPSPERMLEYLGEGIRNLRRSIAMADGLEDDDARKHLTFAWLLESGAHLADRIDTVELLGTGARPSLEEQERISKQIEALASDVPEVAADARAELERSLAVALGSLQASNNSASARRQAAVRDLLTRFWNDRATEEYWITFERAARAEETFGIDPNDRKSSMVHEALGSYRRLVLARGANEEETQRLTAAETRLAELDKSPHTSGISPLLLSLREGCPSLDELTTHNLHVPFDLDGDAVDELWPWLAPDAGWLVWDPERRGEITSGLQLFGSASAWLFFADGYRVLDALDDDRDGELRGAELDGIAVWFDRDTDGVSDRGEVVPLEELGIVALATEASERIGRSLGNQTGAELADGRRIPTYDWVLAPSEP
jgi:hypothetical protein